MTRDRDKNELSLDIKRYTSTSPLHVPDRESQEMWKLLEQKSKLCTDAY